MNKEILVHNLRVFIKKFFNIDITDNNIEYICQDLEEHNVAALLTEYVEYLIGDAEMMIPMIKELLIITNEGKQYK